MAYVPPIILIEEGNRLRSAFEIAKKNRRITQTEMAALCGYRNASSFSRLLTGQKALTFELLEKVSEVLQVSPGMISPRLAHASDSLADKRLLKLLHVSHVEKVTQGVWTEPMVTVRRIQYHSADETSFALTFDKESAPDCLAGWVAILEPESVPLPGDHVVMRLGFGKYSLATVIKSLENGALDVNVAGRGKVLSTRRKCMRIAALLPTSQLI